MPTYISGGLVMVMIAALLGVSIQVADIYHTTRAVDASLQLAEMEMGIQGCVSLRAINLVKERLRREGLNPANVTLNYNLGPGAPRATWGGVVVLRVAYQEPHPLLHNFAATTFDVAVERQIATISGWVGSNDNLCK